MTPSIIDSRVAGPLLRQDLFRQLVVSALVVLQVLLFSYLMSMNFLSALSVALLCSIPVLLICHFLFKLQSRMRYTKMAAVMFAGGGAGMLLGCTADLGQLGLYGLLSLCQTNPVSFSFSGLEVYWQKMQLTPWTYLGMFIGGNLGMLLLEDRKMPALRSRSNIFFTYLVCNAGMVFGMLLAEVLTAGVVGLSNQLLAAGLMVLLMLLGMVAGMLLLLSLSMRVSGANLQLRF